MTAKAMHLDPGGKQGRHAGRLCPRRPSAQTVDHWSEAAAFDPDGQFGQVSLGPARVQVGDAEGNGGLHHAFSLQSRDQWSREVCRSGILPLLAVTEA
jgi:hypothetical protein